jgi:hypothetical protein
MSFIALAIGGAGLAGLGGALISSSAATSASNKAIAAQQQMFNTSVGINQPFVNAGQTADTTLTNLLTPGPNQTATLNQLPGYQFAQDWGQKAVQNVGSIQGFGGNTLTAASNFATGQAQQSFGSLAGLLQNQVNSGVQSAGGLTQAATTTGQGVANSAASGTLGSANALTSGLTGVSNSTLNALLFNKLAGNTGGATNAASGIYSGSGNTVNVSG